MNRLSSPPTGAGARRRWPLWLTLVPLVAGIAFYATLWSGWAEEFRASVAQWLPAAKLTITGFPYRLEANVAAPQLSGGDVVRLSASAATARINRGPWQPDVTVIGTEAPRFAAMVSPVISAEVTGKTALSSVHVDAGKLARLSSVVEAAQGRIGLSPVAIAADTLEIHLRERHDVATPASPTGPARGQAVVTGARLRFGEGDALTFAAYMLVTGPARLAGYDRWAQSGTIEVTGVTLADAHGEVARLVGTLAPVGRDTLQMAGTISTICPLNIAAALAAAPPVTEKRLRAPVLLAFQGRAGAVVLAPPPADLARRPVRGQMPDCPALRR